MNNRRLPNLVSIEIIIYCKSAAIENRMPLNFYRKVLKDYFSLLLIIKSLKKTIMSFIKEFKTFAMSGNIVDLAVAVIIGGAFGSIVSSLVDDIITPLLLTPALQAAHVNDITSLSWGAVKYGNFLSSIIKFTIIAFVLFTIIKAMNAFKKKEEAKSEPEVSSTDQLLTEIRDALKK